MRFGGPITAAAALCAAAALVPAPAAGAESCVRGSEQVVAGNSYLQVVSGRDGDFACLRATGRRHQIGLPGEVILDRAWVAGHHAAYVADVYDGELDFEDLGVVDARSGTQHLLEQAYCARCNPFTSVVLKPNGASAWIADQGHTYDGYERGMVGVWRCSARCLRRDERSRRPTLLDQGHGIEKRSLRRSGSKVSWIRSGRLRRATLR